MKIEAAICTLAHFVFKVCTNMCATLGRGAHMIFTDVVGASCVQLPIDLCGRTDGIFKCASGASVQSLPDRGGRWGTPVAAGRGAARTRMCVVSSKFIRKTRPESVKLDAV